MFGFAESGFFLGWGLLSKIVGFPEVIYFPDFRHCEVIFIFDLNEKLYVSMMIDVNVLYVFIKWAYSFYEVYNIQMEETELKPEVVGSKEQRSRGMNLDGEEHEKELNVKGIDSELTALSNE